MAKGIDLSNMSDPRTMAILGLASGLLQNSGYSTRPITFGEALGSGMQNGMQGYASGVALQGRQQEMAMQQAQHEMLQNELQRKLATQQYLRDAVAKSGGDRKALQQALYQSGDMELMKQAASLGPKVKSTVKGFGADGKPTYQNVFEDGTTESTGIAPAEKAMQVNQGSQISFLDPYSLQNRGAMGVGMAPGEAARLAQSERQFAASHGLAQQNAGLSQQKQLMDMLRLKQELDPEFQAQKAAKIAQSKETAKLQAKGQADLPNAITQGETTIKLVDDILAHPGFNMSVGAKAPLGKVASFVPGTDAASFDIALNQLKGKQFLEAFESLKGGGQITQIEGEKATQAQSRMDKANTQEEFIKAAREFQGILRNGLERAKARAGVQPQQPAAGGFSIRSLD